MTDLARAGVGEGLVASASSAARWFSPSPSRLMVPACIAVRRAIPPAGWMKGVFTRKPPQKWLLGNCFRARRTKDGQPAMRGWRGESRAWRKFACFPFFQFQQARQSQSLTPHHHQSGFVHIPASPSTATMFPLSTDELLPPRWISEKGRDEGERGDVFQCRCFEIQRGFCFAGCGEDLTLMSSALVVQKCSGHIRSFPATGLE